MLVVLGDRSAVRSGPSVQATLNGRAEPAMPCGEAVLLIDTQTTKTSYAEHVPGGAGIRAQPPVDWLILCGVIRCAKR